MLEGTDEAPRKVWISKDFSALFAVGMLIAWINAVILLHSAGYEEFYIQTKMDLPLPTQLFITLKNSVYIALFSSVYLGVLTLFWINQCKKCLWILGIWMLWGILCTVAAAEAPKWVIHFSLRKKGDFPRFDENFQTLIIGVSIIELLLILAVLGCLISIIRKKLKAWLTPP